MRALDTGSEVSEVSCYSVASVFTPVHQRGKGYAKHMMRLLHWGMTSHADLPLFPQKAWGAPPPSVEKARISILYSDVGDRFYSQCGPDERVREGGGGGWVVRGAVGTIWEVKFKSAVLNKGKEAPTTSNPGEYEWEWLDIPGAEALWETDAAWMRDDLIKSVKSTGRTSFTILPGEGVGAFQIHQSSFLMPGMPSFPRVKQWGVILKDEGGDKPTFATWTIDVRPPPPTLVITRLRASVTTFPQLLGKVWEVARQHRMQRIETWNLSAELVQMAAELGGKTVERDEQLPAFKIYGGEGEKEVDWLFNEKLVYCYHNSISW